ncbi:MAG: hypothetical protein HQL29_06340 [Candidatus Omnitrophica bacterium]|nr:hypothetical protein [Candidatus Omnitrophota bacterium]
MNENDFWSYLNAESAKGMAQCIVGCMDPEAMDELPELKYLAGHSLLPANYENVPQDKIIGMGKLLFDKNIKIKTKESILILLAHQTTKDALFFLQEYNKCPDSKLRIFAELALDECLMWNS